MPCLSRPFSSAFRNLSFSCAFIATSVTISLAQEVIKPDDVSASYDWKPIRIGGGGWVTGMDISPTEKGLIYARTDVSGAYRWIPETSSWKQILTIGGMPNGSLSYGFYGGVDSLVGAPSSPDIAYMAFAGKPYGENEGQIFRSTNRGDTWTATNFYGNKVLMEGNGPDRQSGERLAVDPANSDVVYFDSMSNGLWTTTDGGKSWSKVNSIPDGMAKHGVNTVVFAPLSGKVDGNDQKPRTKDIFVTVVGAGVFQSKDAGLTWKNISASDPGPGHASKTRDATMGPDGNYYVVHDDENGTTGSVWKFAPDGTWSNITPPPPEGGSKTWWAVAVNPADPNYIIAMQHGGKCFVSKDQGSTWSFHSFKLKSAEIEWQEKQVNYFLSMGEIGFDPFEPSKLWFAEGLGVWYANALLSRKSTGIKSAKALKKPEAMM